MCDLVGGVRLLLFVFFLPATLYSQGVSMKETVHQIGFLSGAGSLHLEDIFINQLKSLGFEEGKNLRIQVRLAMPNTSDVRDMAKELANMDLEFIVVGSLPIALEVRKNNPRMPMVIATCPGMVSNGFAESRQHPGGIYTGLDELPVGVTATRIQLLKAAVPSATRIALLSSTPGIGGHETQLAEAEETARSLGVQVKPYRVSSLTELREALNAIMVDRMEGIVIFQGALTLANRQAIVDFAADNKIPVIYQQSAFVDVGGLMSWAPDLEQQFREAAEYAAKILNGAKAGDLPIKYPEKYFLTLNKTAATKIGVTFSPGLIERATRIVE